MRYGALTSALMNGLSAQMSGASALAENNGDEPSVRIDPVLYEPAAPAYSPKPGETSIESCLAAFCAEEQLEGVVGLNFAWTQRNENVFSVLGK